jgi:hypothetical protein
MLDIVSSSLLGNDLCLEANIRLVTTGKIMTMEELSNVQGRAWEDVDVSALTTDSTGVILTSEQH